MIPLTSYLMQGELMELGDTRARAVRKMADILLSRSAFADRDDAIKLLTSAGCATIDVFVLVDDAIYLAKQDVLAREFCGS